MLTARVDVTEQIAAKRAGMRAHPSQIADDSWFLGMPDEHFAEVFGTEWFIRVGADPRGAGGEREVWLF